MKYVIYTGVFFMPDGNAAAQRAHAIEQILKKLGYTPIIIGMNQNGDSGKILESKYEKDDSFYYSINYPQKSIDWIKVLFEIDHIKTVVNTLGCENVHAIIAMDYFSIALNRLIKYCKRNNIRFIADTVDWFAKSNYKFPKRIIKDFDTFYRMKIVHKKSEYMITISSFLKKYYTSNVKKIVQIPGMFVPLKCNLKTYESNKILTLAFVGSPGKKCEKEKIDWVIQAVCKINKEKIRIKVILVGVDKKSLEVNRPDITALNKFDESIDCLGRLEHDACIDIITRSDFSVIIREDTLLSNAGFPTKLGESYACGTPVLATPTSDIADYVPEGYGFVTETCTYEAVEKGIYNLLLLPQTYIENMHMKIRRDNPLSYTKFVKAMQEVID